MTFEQWRQLPPGGAAAEVLRRADSRLGAAQRRAAIAVLADAGALEAAFAAAPPGPLRGVPYLAKDLFDAPGMPTFAGSSFLPEVRPVPQRPSAIIGALGAAGAVLAGKTHMFEFAWGLTGENAHYGDCERPGFPGRTSGGSSSGSAAAVAAGVVPLALGSDTGGSIRVPAAFCGLFGFRGVPRSPLIADAVPLAPSYDTAGWFTATARDMRVATAVLAGMRTSERAPRGCYLEMPGVDAEVAAACRRAAAAFTVPADAATGDELAHKFEPCAEVYGVLAGVEAWKYHKRWADRHRERYGPLVRDRIERARSISPAQVAAVESSQASLVLAWTRYFLSFDFLAMPSAPFAALAKADCTPANRLRMLSLTAPASLAGLPALAVPVPLASGLSAGLQVVFSDPQSPVVPWVLDRLA